MYYLSRRSQKQVKFPDIWTVNQSFQKQTLDIFLIMIRLQTLIAERIITTKSIRTDIEKFLRQALPIVGVDAQFKTNRAVLKYLSGQRRKDRERSSEEQGLLDDIKDLRFLSSKTIEDVYLTSLAIFTTYDPFFPSFAEQQTAQRIKAIYLAFFEKYESKISVRMVFKMLSHHLTESSPYILLGWVSEWSRSLLSQAIQASIEEEMARHDQQMKRLSNIRGSSISIIKEKASPYANSTALPRPQSVIQAIFTNKESVYGLFLDQMMAYYKFLPLDLDLTFLKSMRKVHNSHNLLQNEENLQKAAEALIESQNRHTREQIKAFFGQCQQYLDRFPNALRNVKALRKKEKRNNLSLSPQVKSPKLSKKHLPKQKFFQRVKSQSKQQASLNPKDKRNSFLLHPKTNLICFQSSHELVSKKQKQSKIFQLPSLVQSNRILSENIRSSMLKNRQANSFFVPINRSLISNYERGILKSFAIPSKPPTISIQKTEEKLSYSQPRMPSIKEYPPSTKQGGQRRKRKLMLQMLRDKNKRAFLE